MNPLPLLYYETLTQGETPMTTEDTKSQSLTDSQSPISDPSYINEDTTSHDEPDIGQVISALLTEYHEPTEPTNGQLREQLAIGDLIISKVTGSHLIILTQSQLEYSRDILRTFPTDSSSYLLLKERKTPETQGPDESPETET